MAKAKESQRYHHGDLRAALVRAADEILEEQGVERFSMREAARRVGVSAAAPAHHFGSAAGLLTEVAAQGFAELARYMDVGSVEAAPMERLRHQCEGYVRFALAYPGRFHLMFRRDLLSDGHAGLDEAAHRSYGQIEHTIREIHVLPDDAPMTEAASAMLLATWTMAHGFAHLLLDGKLTKVYEGASAEFLLENVLPSMLRHQFPDDGLYIAPG